MHWIPLGDSAVLLTLPSRADAGKIAAQIENERATGFVECVPAFESVAICYDPRHTNPMVLMDSLAKPLTRALKSKVSSRKRREIVIPVCYGGEFGPDLTDVANHSKVDPQAVIKLHTAGRYVVRALGFMPGFPYLAGLNEKLHTPRRDTPRTHIPAGSVGIGGAQTGIYPLTSPGGWNLIGRTPAELFNPANAEAPTLLRPGDRVRFTSISEEEFAKWK